MGSIPEKEQKPPKIGDPENEGRGRFGEEEYKFSGGHPSGEAEDPVESDIGRYENEEDGDEDERAEAHVGRDEHSHAAHLQEQEEEARYEAGESGDFEDYVDETKTAKP